MDTDRTRTGRGRGPVRPARPHTPGVTGHWRGRGAGVARACRQVLSWVARAWRGHGAGMSCDPRATTEVDGNKRWFNCATSACIWRELGFGGEPVSVMVSRMLATWRTSQTVDRARWKSTWSDIRERDHLALVWGSTSSEISGSRRFLVAVNVEIDT
eukprot:gene24511-biopygen19429